MTDTSLLLEKDFLEIRKNFDHLIKNVSQEIDAHKEEQCKIKQQLLTFIAANDTNLENQPTPEVASEFDALTCDAISNLKQQVHHLQIERDVINKLWNISQETIKNLEIEVENYRNHLFKTDLSKIKEKHQQAIASLEKVVVDQKTEIAKQACAVNELIKEKNVSVVKMKKLQAVILNQEQELTHICRLKGENAKLKEQLKEVMQANSELELAATCAKELVNKRFDREKDALDKLQEALLIAEAAVAEKEEILKRELIIKDECESLAGTISQVMEEAARKVDRDIEALRQKYTEKERSLLLKHEEALDEIERQVDTTRVALNKSCTLQQKVEQLRERNIKLENDLKIASEAIMDLELKLAATEKLLNEDRKSELISREREKQIKQYIEENNKLKERWKCTIEELTEKFGTEIQRLTNENTYLRSNIKMQCINTRME